MSSTIVIVGLDPLMSLGIQTVLSAISDHAVVEHIEDGDRAVALAHDGAVDLAIVDPCRPNLDEGLRFCRRLKEVRSPPYLLALARLTSTRDVMYCFLSGVDSFVSNVERPERLVSAVTSTLAGR